MPREERNAELRRDLARIAALADAIAGLAGLVPGDCLEAAMAELVMATRAAYEGLIDRAILTEGIEGRDPQLTLGVARG